MKKKIKLTKSYVIFCFFVHSYLWCAHCSVHNDQWRNKKNGNCDTLIEARPLTLLCGKESDKRQFKHCKDICSFSFASKRMLFVSLMLLEYNFIYVESALLCSSFLFFSYFFMLFCEMPLQWMIGRSFQWENLSRFHFSFSALKINYHCSAEWNRISAMKTSNRLDRNRLPTTISLQEQNET